jgi:hypothetical protein
VELHRFNYWNPLNGQEIEGRAFSYRNTSKTPVGTSCNRLLTVVAILHVFLCAPYLVLIPVISLCFRFLLSRIIHLLRALCIQCVLIFQILAGLIQARTEQCSDYVNILYMAV